MELCSRPEYSWKIARWTLNTNQLINQLINQSVSSNVYFLYVEIKKGTCIYKFIWIDEYRMPKSEKMSNPIQIQHQNNHQKVKQNNKNTRTTQNPTKHESEIMSLSKNVKLKSISWGRTAYPLVAHDFTAGFCESHVAQF